MALIDNLIAYWKLDEATGNKSDSHGSNTLTNNNSVSSVAGIINNASSFSSASSKYLSGTKIGHTYGVPMSYNFWVNLPSTSEVGAFLEDSGNGGISNGFAVGVGSGTLDGSGNHLIIPFWGVDWQETGVSIGTGWHMITIIITASNKSNAYIDGTLVFTGTSTMGAFANSPFLIGRSEYVSAYRYLSNGYVDEVGVWNKALTSGEITSLYNAGSGVAYPFSGGAPAFIPKIMMS